MPAELEICVCGMPCCEEFDDDVNFLGEQIFQLSRHG